MWELRDWVADQWRLKASQSRLLANRTARRDDERLMETDVEHGAHRAKPDQLDALIDVVAHDGSAVDVTTR